MQLFYFFFFLRTRRPPSSPLFPTTTLFRSEVLLQVPPVIVDLLQQPLPACQPLHREARQRQDVWNVERLRSEEHTSELQSPCNLVCRLLLEKKINTGLGALLGHETLDDRIV